MTDIANANKQRNREIAHNEEARRITGSVRVSIWAIAVAVALGTILFAIGWIAVRQ
jgi:hypothetical protein